jgi:hypothetical protein
VVQVKEALRVGYVARVSAPGSVVNSEGASAILHGQRQSRSELLQSPWGTAGHSSEDAWIGGFEVVIRDVRHSGETGALCPNPLAARPAIRRARMLTRHSIAARGNSPHSAVTALTINWP